MSPTEPIRETALSAQIRTTIENAEKALSEARTELYAANASNLAAFQKFCDAAPAEHMAWKATIEVESAARKRAREAQEAYDQALKLKSALGISDEVAA